MEQNRIITLVAVALVILDMLWFLIRGLKNGFGDKGKRTKDFIFRSILIYIFAVAIIAISWFREFGLLGDIIFCGCGVIAVEIENRQYLGLLNEDDQEDYE